MDRVNPRPRVQGNLSPRSRDDEDVLVFRSVLVDIRNLFVNIALHPAAQRRIKLRQIANLQEKAAAVGQALRLPTKRSAGDAPALQFAAIDSHLSSSLIPDGADRQLTFRARSDSAPHPWLRRSLFRRR